MYILKSDENRFMDQFTIQQEPISSVDLMERAALRCAYWLTNHLLERAPITIYCGTGNNGGDGLAITRLLCDQGWDAHAMLIQSKNQLSPDNEEHLKRLQELHPNHIRHINPGMDIPPPRPGYVVDALFGTGISRAAEGLELRAIEVMNASGQPIIAVDLPSGLTSNESSLTNVNKIIKAKHTLTFQFLKPCLVMPENMQFFGQVTILDIGLDSKGLDQIQPWMELITPQTIQQLLKHRSASGHKGSFGHAVLMAGGHGKAGAGILAAKSCLRSGCGLLSLVIPKEENQLFQATLPEAMTIPYCQELPIKSIPAKTTALGVGPGIGLGPIAAQTLEQLIGMWSRPMVLDADAINLVSEQKVKLSQIPDGSLFTPHVGEFERLVSKQNNDFERLDAQQAWSKSTGHLLLVKGAFTKITTPEGRVWVNPTGNAGMAKGGSGDILTGLITGLHARGYTLEESAIIGAYLHGLAGDLCAQQLGMEAMTAGDIISKLPEAWKRLKNDTFN